MARPKKPREIVVFDDVPEFTADEFVSSDEPYKFIESYGNNPFEMRQMFAKVSMIARSVGITGFNELWSDYKKSIEGRVPTDINQTQFGLSFPIGELESGPYICGPDGVAVEDGFKVVHTICPHPIAPIRRYKNIDTGEELLEIWFRRGNTENFIKDDTIIFPKNDIANGISKLAKYGVVVTKKNEKDLSAYLLDMEDYNYDYLEERQSVKRLGWVGKKYDTFSPYVGNMYFDGEEDYGHLFGTVREFGSYEKWKSIVRDVRKEKTAARFYLAASFASVILKPCGLLPFLVHAWGGTENGKTVSLMLAASVWACPEMGEYVTSYNSTTYGLETTAGFLNSLPLCMDELQIKSSQGAKDFDSIIYQLCEGVSKKQGTASGGLRKQSRWRNVILSTGEHTIIKPLSGGGARNRVIEIEAPEKIYHDLVGLCDVINHNYGHAGKEFVQWLLDGDPEDDESKPNISRIQQLQKDFYHQLLERNVTEKQAGSASAILAADHIVTELIFQDDMALTVDDMSAVLLKKGDVDINRKTLEWIYDLIDMNPQHFERDGKSEVWGWIDQDDDRVYFYKEAFNTELKNAGLDSKSFLSWASRQGAIVSNKGRTDLSVRQDSTGKQKRVYCIKLGLFQGEQDPNLVTNGLFLPGGERSGLCMLNKPMFTELCNTDELPF